MTLFSTTRRAVLAASALFLTACATAKAPQFIAASGSPKRLLFVGSLDYFPNTEGLKWFCAQIWPQILKEVPDINVQQEMVDLIISQRTYEANLAVARSSKSMAMQTLSIGRRS